MKVRLPRNLLGTDDFGGRDVVHACANSERLVIPLPQSGNSNNIRAPFNRAPQQPSQRQKELCIQTNH